MINKPKNKHHGALLNCLPHFITFHQFLNDLKILFSATQWNSPQPPKNNLHHRQYIYKPSHHLIELKNNLKYQQLLEIEQIDCQMMFKFFERFPQTALYSDILHACGNSADYAAIMFIKILQFLEKKMPQMTFSTLTLLMGNLAKTGIPILNLIYSGIWGPNSKQNLENLKKCIEIQKILDKIRYKFNYIQIPRKLMHESFFPSDDAQPRRIKNFTEQIIPSEFLQDEAILLMRMTLKEIHTFQHFSREDKPKKFVMLIDTSGSMQGFPTIYACAAGIAMVENVLASAQIGIIIPFDSVPKKYRKFNNLQEATNFLLKTPFSGGGTNINRALMKADEFKPDEIILLTDGDDNVTYQPKAPLYTIFCSDETNSGLESISTKYEQYEKAELT